MNVFVLLKQVPGTSNVKMDEQTGTMIRTEHENIINPLDENALEEALRLRRSMQGAKVTVVSMGPPSAIKALREAVAVGADSAVLLSDKGFSGSDTLATARALARALEKLVGGCLDGDHLMLCGEKATDGETGQVGPMVSSFLDVSVVTYVRKISLEGAFVLAERAVEEGIERVKVPLPAVLTVVKDINRPGLPNLSGKLKALQARGKLSGEHGIGGKRRKYLSRFMDPVAVEVIKAIKKAFDPNLILNPGKIVEL
ncbi:MAG: FAD-linked oxidase C-terminal domain-containing protein [Bacillota bacterium]